MRPYRLFVNSRSGMDIHRLWPRARKKMMSFGLRADLKPFGIRFDGAALRQSLNRYYDALYRSRERVLLANAVSGGLIAFSVFFLGQSAFLDDLVNRLIMGLLAAKGFIAQRRGAAVPPFLAILTHGAAILFAAWVCSYFRSIGKITALNGALIFAMLLASLAAPAGFMVPLGASVVVFLMTVGALLDAHFERRFLRRLFRNIADKQQTEHAILRHISHSVNPTVQTALSPLRSALDHLTARGHAGEVLARRRDGSGETVGAALETAVVSLHQIREIIETTEDIFGNRIDVTDFEEVSLPDIFHNEIFPLFSGARFELRLECQGACRVKLHRPSFVQAVKNIVRNAEVHGFPDGYAASEPPFVLFSIRETVKEVVIDYRNNGAPFPRGIRTRDFLTFGKKGKNSPGKGLGGAWVEKFIEVHGGRFKKISNNPVQFRITLPKRRT